MEAEEHGFPSQRPTAARRRRPEGRARPASPRSALGRSPAPAGPWGPRLQPHSAACTWCFNAAPSVCLLPRSLSDLGADPPLWDADRSRHSLKLKIKQVASTIAKVCEKPEEGQGRTRKLIAYTRPLLQGWRGGGSGMHANSTAMKPDHSYTLHGLTPNGLKTNVRPKTIKLQKENTGA